MNTRLFLAAAALTLAGAAQAQTVDQRHVNQQTRIDAGVATGRLTPGEAARDERQQGRIDSTEARMRAVHGGRLTPSDRARLQVREGAADAHVYDTKHNARQY